ncbi:MAG: excinuclease ABC subunit UvrC [Pseudomonadota bacterium]
MSSLPDTLLEKYETAPSDPGVYLMKDVRGEIIYVGKARHLKKRLSSYFVRETGHDMKTGVLIKHIADFDVIVTSTEQEALLLESTLIKKHSPRYNVILKDGKNYPCLRIDTTQDYSCLEVVRRMGNDKAAYFGPYPSVHSVRSTLRSVNKIFKLRKCRQVQFRNRSRPCLNFQINTCLGPCCNPVPRPVYDAIVRDVILFLRGRAPELLKRLRADMAREAGNEEFEKAAQIRDTIAAIERTLEKQVAVSTDQKDRDVIACAGDRGRAVVTVLFVRAGYLSGSRNFPFDMTYADLPEILEAFVKQFYSRAMFIPGEILVPQVLEEWNLLEEQLSKKKGKRVAIIAPVRGEKKQILDMARLNAVKELEQSLSDQAETREILLMLQNLIRMDAYPGRIECFDNSNLAGTDPVSAMVVFTRGVSDKGQYRHYILNPSNRQDDYACMTEVLTRRFLSGGTDTAFPDLLVVDGGKGQLSMAVAVLRELGLENRFQVVGLAKKDRERGEDADKIYLPGRSNPLNTSQAQKALFLLQRLRDEAHRFAITFQKKRRSGRAGLSILDGIPGMGPKRKAMLLKTFKGLGPIREAGVDGLASLPGITRQVAEAVITALNQEA